MKIGIYGGTFDPPHIGHINACKAFLEKIDLDVLYVIPVFIPPHKDLNSTTSPSQRLEMTKLAFSPISEKIKISDMEIKRTGKSYTSDTIFQFKKMFSDGEIYFLCGTDMILTMDSWHDTKYIFENATIVYVRRESDSSIGTDIEKKCNQYINEYGAKIVGISTNVVEISSTEVRENSVCCKDLTPEIKDYIIENGLYK